jgi:predicted transcriptional regulator
LQRSVECPIAYLPPHVRNSLVKIALEEGYAVKDLAEIMGVSSAAVSRYIHGTLSPSIESTCRLILSVDNSLRAKMLQHIILQLLDVVGRLTDELAKISEHEGETVLHALEKIADKISSIMLKLSTVQRETILKP